MAHKILLVDDDPDFTAIHKEILEKDGFQVSVIHNSVEAAEALETGKESPDLIMCDLMMEKDDSGFKFCHRIRRNPKTAKLPILMCTGVARARSLGFDIKSPEAREWIKADDFVEKPIRAETLLAKVHHLLGEPAVTTSGH